MEAASYVPVLVGCPARRGSVYVMAPVPAKDKGVKERSTGLSNKLSKIISFTTVNQINCNFGILVILI